MNHADRGHSVLGASSAYRWMACPGSVKMLQDNPMPTSPAAADGTLTHELAELVLLDLLNGRDTLARLDDTEDDRYERAMFYAERVQDKFSELNMYGDAEYAIEKSFQLPMDDRFFGTNDAAVWNEDELHVFDLKDGFGVVDAEGNTQLMYYALGILTDMPVKPERVFLHIIMPRHESHDVWEVTHEELNVFADQLQISADSVDINPEVYLPGEHCKFCNKTACSAFQKDMAEQALVAFDDNGELPDLTTVSLPKLTSILAYESRVMQFFKDAKAILTEEAKQGKDIDGFKLVRKQGNRRWLDADAVLKNARKWKLKKEDMYEKKLKSPAQMKKLGVHQSDIDQLTERPDNGVSLVPMSSKGEPVCLSTSGFQNDDVGGL